MFVNSERILKSTKVSLDSYDKYVCKHELIVINGTKSPSESECGISNLENGKVLLYIALCCSKYVSAFNPNPKLKHLQN